MTVTYASFDISDTLDNDEVIAEYLTAASQDENPMANGLTTAKPLRLR